MSTTNNFSHCNIINLNDNLGVSAMILKIILKIDTSI